MSHLSWGGMLCEGRGMSMGVNFRGAALAVLAGWAVACLPGAWRAHAQPAGGGFQAYVQVLAARARAEGVSEPTIARMTAGLSYNPRVVELDRNQPGSGVGANPAAAPDFGPYYRAHVDAARIGQGRAMYAATARWIPGIEQRYGVPAGIMLAIWGNETNYGRYSGDFDLARSLATLAYDGRRRELFASEFVALLKVADRGIPRERLVGSWAGAFGNPQFLPSTYLRVAADGNNDGNIDIWNDRADTMASIANYFHDAGWHAGEPWGVRAYVPAGLSRQGVTSGLVSPECARVHARYSRWLTVREWRALGVQPRGAIGENTLAALIEPDGQGKTAFLLTGNYRVILQYNCSNYYALSVGLLSDEISQ